MPESALSEDRLAELPVESARDRFRTIFNTHVDFVARYVRRLGVPEHAVEDATQNVFIVVAAKVDQILPGAERSYVVGVAQRVASDARYLQSRRREDSDDGADFEDGRMPSPDELLDQKRARELLDEVLLAMPIELRTAFVLFELEGLTTDEMADALELPRGTAASRLRRAREEFQTQVAKRTRPGRGGQR